MMPKILLSIKPKYCELIASCRKKIEIRKTRPKLEPPFKCYIYCSKGRYFGNSKVIGEFVCDAIIPISVTYSDPNHRLAQREFPLICLSDKEIIDYLGNEKTGYGWHISKLKIYDEPKELSEFGLTRPPQSWCYVEGNNYRRNKA